MTEAEMYLVGDLLFSCGRQLAAFDERSSDKRLLIVTTDAPTVARYVIASPMTSTLQKALAGDSLKEFIAADSTVSTVQQTPFEDDDRVMYCAPDSDQQVPSDEYDERAGAVRSRDDQVELAIAGLLQSDPCSTITVTARHIEIVCHTMNPRAESILSKRMFCASQNMLFSAVRMNSPLRFTKP